MNRHLSLSTVSFALCFAMWGLIGALGPLLRQTFNLTGTQAAFLVVAPVLLGSLARIPAGMLSDRFGGRAVFTTLMVFVALAAAIYLTTGRVVSQYLSGTQTRRIGALVDQYPEPRVEIHPQLAEAHGIRNNDWVVVTTRRTDMRVRAMVVRTIRPDTVFIPYHWPGRRSANRLTHRTIDPRSKIPEFKVSACKISRAD